MRMVIDPRCGRKTKHDHAEILTYLVVGYLAGRDSIRRCLKWCENHIDFLRQHLELKNGIASPATVSRILGNIDEEIFLSGIYRVDDGNPKYEGNKHSNRWKSITWKYGKD